MGTRECSPVNNGGNYVGLACSDVLYHNHKDRSPEDMWKHSASMIKESIVGIGSRLNGSPLRILCSRKIYISSRTQDLVVGLHG